MYHPVLMARPDFTVTVFELRVRARSSRLLTIAWRFAILAADQQLDHAQLSFLSPFYVGALFHHSYKPLRLCQKAGSPGNVSIDGPKMKANASTLVFRGKYERISAKEEHWRAEVARLLSQAQQTDREEERRLSRHPAAYQLPDEFSKCPEAIGATLPSKG